jgi:hypothetical protein
MLIREIAERIINTVSVLKTNQDRWDEDFIISLVDSAAAWAKQEKFKKEKSIPEQWTYEYTLPYVQSEQDSESCYTTYWLPPFLTLPYGANGISSVRGKKGAPIRVYENSTTFENTRLLPLFNNKKPVAFVEGNTLKTLNIDLGDVKVRGLFTRLLEDPNFNVDFDEFTITQDLLWLMSSYITAQVTDKMSIRPVPETNNQSMQNQQ